MARARYALLLILPALALSSMAGCEQQQKEGQVYHKLSSAWPLFDIEKWEGADPDGSHWKKEKGDALCWLAIWEKEEKYDKDNFRIYRKKKSSFFPLFSAEVEETPDFKKRWGSILFYPYHSERKK